MQAAALRPLESTMAEAAAVRVELGQTQQTIRVPREASDCRRSQLMVLFTAYQMCLERPTQTWLF